MPRLVDRNLRFEGPLLHELDHRGRVPRIRDTTELQTKIDLSKYTDLEEVNPTSLVVVDQFPKAGEKLPLGTPVTLTFMSKDSIRVVDIAGLGDALKEKYEGGSIKKITDDIQSDAEAKEVLAANKEFSDMTATEKEVLKKYAVEKGLADASATDEKVEKIHGDLAFIFNI